MCTKVIVISALYASLKSHTAAQSPGPDWPLCASISKGHHPGFEIVSMRYTPEGFGYESWSGEEAWFPASLSLDFHNAADGSTTSCQIERKSVTKGDATEYGALDSTLSDEFWGGCESGWTLRGTSLSPWDRSSDEGAPNGTVRFDLSSKELFISQPYKCRDDGGQLLTFTAAASGIIDLECSWDRDGNQRSCFPPKEIWSYLPPYFLGPAAVSAPAPEAPSSPAIQKATPTATCPDGNSHPGYQIIDMFLIPPLPPHRTGSPYPSTSAAVELRNLADESRTRCYFRSNDVTGAETEGVLLWNDNLLSKQSPQDGCWTGAVRLLPPDGKETGEKRLEQDWRMQERAVVTFNTKTLRLTVNQTWNCLRGGDSGGGSPEVVTVSSLASRELVELKCGPSGSSYYPLFCRAAEGLTLTNSSGPALIGPATLSFSTSGM